MDQHSFIVEYHVPVAPGGMADIFDQLESNKATLQIKHFSVSQTTLDEVSERDRERKGYGESEIWGVRKERQTERVGGRDLKGHYVFTLQKSRCKNMF
uniref:ABCA1-4-like C-terminal R2 regulatory domain-containing protein n=1 Tax=Hucho hucho TaxID=62062 RepID=A0A4W5KN17_9TELE